MQFEKLKIAEHDKVHICNVPDGIHVPFKHAQNDFSAILAFVQTNEQLSSVFELLDLNNLPLKVVFAYPKGTSKKFKSDVNRDDIIKMVKQDGRLGAPRLVSLDDDWSGFMFKRTQ